MVRWLAAPAVLVALGCAHGTAPAVTDVAPATPKEVVAAARGVLEQWRQAQEVKSFETLSRLYAHDTDVVVVQEGTPLIGWSSVEAMLQDRLATATAIHVRLKDIAVSSLSPTVASALATMTREVQTNNTTVTEAGTITIVLRRAESADAPWLIVAEHYSYKGH
jgi:ketosteroid isomerase-like protein